MASDDSSFLPAAIHGRDIYANVAAFPGSAQCAFCLIQQDFLPTHFMEFSLAFFSIARLS
jgi:S-adenosylmethionine hydrolase